MIVRPAHGTPGRRSAAGAVDQEADAAAVAGPRRSRRSVRVSCCEHADLDGIARPSPIHNASTRTAPAPRSSAHARDALPSGGRRRTAPRGVASLRAGEERRRIATAAPARTTTACSSSAPRRSRAAQPLQRTLRVSLPAAEAAGVHHADVAQREIEPHRIVGIQRAQRRGDVGRHPPARADVYRVSRRQRPSRMTCVSSGTISCAGDTSVQTPRSTSSRRTIQRRIQVQPLARAAGRRPREEVAHARRASARRPYDRPESSASARRRKAVERGADVLGVRVAARRRRTARSSPTRSSICRRIQSSAAMSSPRVQRCTIARSSGCGADGSKRAHERRRVRPHDPEQRVDRVEHARDAPERQRRGAEAGDLAVRRRRDTAGRGEPDRSPSPRGCSRRTADRAPTASSRWFIGTRPIVWRLAAARVRRPRRHHCGC